MQKFDFICIGAGSGGIAAANRAALHGAKVLLIEADILGGACVNVGCIPKKVMWTAAKMQHELKQYAADHGVTAVTQPHNWRAMCDSRNAYIKRIHGFYENYLLENKVTVKKGFASFQSNNIVAVADAVFTAPHILIATGTKPIIPDIAGADLGIDSDDFFALKAMPKRVAIIGAGYIAVEFAGALNALGADTNLLIRYDQPLRKFDQDLSSRLKEFLINDSIKLHESTKIAALRKVNNGIAIDFVDSKQASLEVDCVIWAIGRAPAVKNLSLTNTDVELDNSGFIKVDSWQNTTATGVYAVGDIMANGVQLTPVAVKAGRTLAMRLFANHKQKCMDYTNIPSVVFSHPPIATVGLTEAEAVATFGKEALMIYTSKFSPMLSAVTKNKQSSFMKMICLKQDKRIIGLHGIGDAMDEMIQGFAVAIKMGATKDDFDATVAVHPTSSEEFVLMK